MERWPRIPVVYHDGYNLKNPQAFFAPREIYQKLLASGLNGQSLYEPTQICQSDLKWTHEEVYIKTISNDRLINSAMNSAMYATGGTILACRTAPKYGWAINLGGGFNLALPDQSVGECLISDVSMAIHSVWNDNPYTTPQILVIDLSARQNTSYVEIFQNRFYPQENKIHQLNVNLKLFQMYDPNKFTSDDETLNDLITFNIPLNKEITGQEYLDKLNKFLVEALEKIKEDNYLTGSFYPELIIYVAGTDLLDVMPNIHEEDIIKRDALIFSLSEKYKIPVAMVLGSCTTQKNSDVASRSILNILKLKKVLE
jgi:histone deacetylase 11